MGSTRRSNEIPQLPTRPLIGNAGDIEPNAPIQSMIRIAGELGPIYRLSFPGQSVIILGSRELAADACDESRFVKHIHAPLENLRALGGDGLFTARDEDPNWGKAHRLLAPAFGPKAMRNYFDDMIDIADQMFTRWERFGPDDVITVTDSMTRLTLDTIALCGFAYRFNSFYSRDMHPFVDAMVRALEEASQRSRRLPVQTRLMFRTQRQYEADTAYMHEVTNEVIAKRKLMRLEDAPRDLLGLMLNAADPLTGVRLSDENIGFQLVTFLIAGHETTSGLLSFATYELLRHPRAMQLAREEADRVLGSELPRFEHLARLVYIDQVLRETLRLYPTAPAFAVEPRRDTTLAGRYPVKRGESLAVLIPVLHVDPKVWKDPSHFDPDRFAPAVRERIPDKAWLPFGSGQRACIGRAFAMQEATLVLAMMLQRFDLSEVGPYQLKIKETLTMKPDGLRMRARIRKPVERTLSTRPAPMVGRSFAPEAITSHDTPLLLLYGSNSGASEAFARRIASDGLARGYLSKVAPLDAYTGNLPKHGAVVVVTASYNGQPPDNARAFYKWLANVPEASLVGVKYAVFGCGNRDWGSTYQSVPKEIDERLREAGAQAIAERGEADARADFFGDFERWYRGLWGALRKTFGIALQEITSGPLYTVRVVPSATPDLAKQNRLSEATVLENRELVDLSAPFARSKRHIEFSLPQGETYAAGDYLAVLPENHPELVDRAARRFGVRQDASLLLQSTRGAMAASLPTGRPVSLQELLGRYVELSAPATRTDVEVIAERTTCPPHKTHLANIAADATAYQTEILDARLSALDLLETYPSCDLSFAEFLELLPAMRVRQYSIASSPRCDAARCALTVAVVDGPARSGRGRFHGTASSFLARLKKGDSVPVAVKTPNVPFRPPPSNETPMVMICAGAGLAPFRGFLQERAARRGKGEPAGEALLFFGCDHPDVDFLYKSEIDAWQSEGLVQVFPAFFEKPDGDVKFVQHRVWNERARVRSAFERGAIVFVCGDGLRMAPAVRGTLAKIHQESSSCTDDEAARWIEEMERVGRYVPDVFA
jgi:cytochrome P450/NADPH-cytochrome P450 reductase